MLCERQNGKTNPADQKNGKTKRVNDAFSVHIGFWSFFRGNIDIYIYLLNVWSKAHAPFFSGELQLNGRVRQAVKPNERSAAVVMRVQSSLEFSRRLKAAHCAQQATASWN